MNGVAQNKSCYSVVIDDSGCATIGLRDFIRSRVRTSGLRVGVVAYWVPTEQTPELPPMWWSKHNRAIRYAALKMLLSQVGNPWGNEATAVRFADEYYKCVQDALVSRRIEDGGQLNCFDPSSTFVVGGF